MDPMNFESFITNKKVILENDPLREILLYPPDDVSCVVLPRRWRTVNTTVPDARVATTCPLLTRQALLSYVSSWNLVHYKYSAYSGSYLDLPRCSPILFSNKEDVYEVDIDTDVIDKSHTATKTDSIIKQGYLLKGPEIGSDRIFVNLTSKTFKKRYCYLRQETDGSYVLDVHKDEKREDAKLSILIDCSLEVTRNPKRYRNCFEIRMETGIKGYTFASESENELEEWITSFLSILQHAKPEDISSKECKVEEPLNLTIMAPPPIYGTLKGLEHSMNPLLISYAKETDMSISFSRNYARNHLFIIPHNAVFNPEPQIEPFKEQFGQRILLKCESVKFRFQAPIDGEKEMLCQVEPYYTYLALFDSRNGKKITENFYFDVNHVAVKDMIQDEANSGLCNGTSEVDPKLNLTKLPEDWFKTKKQAILSINNPHPDIFLVIRIDKILQGSVQQVTEPYVKATKDPRLGLKVHKTVKTYASRLGTYRMPFAWAAKPLFRIYSNEVDTGPDFPAIFRQETGRMSDDDLLKTLSEFRKPDKMSKLTLIPGWIKINIHPCTEQPTNSLTCGWAPIKSFPMPPTSPCTLELATINSPFENPHSTYVNHLYIYPILLNFDSQKIFARARNIACHVEVRESDSQGAIPLNIIYGVNGMVSKRICAVVHHNTSPLWFDEIKIRLPVMLTSTHHILFTFYHVSCDISKKQDYTIESCVGYSWIPLLKNGKLIEEMVNLPVASHLASGYLLIQPLGLGKGNAGPDTVWIDGEKPLFRCNFTLDSTVLTRDPHLQNLFSHAEKLVQPQIGSMPPETETCKILKAGHGIQLTTLIQFLPTIMNQLFEVLAMVQGTSDVGIQVVRLIVHLVHMIYDAGRKDLLESYIKYVFLCVGNGIHEHLMAPLHSFVESSQQDFLLGHKFMQHSSFFFQIITKSMAQYLINTGRIKMCRTERFPIKFVSHIEKLVNSIEPSYILQQPIQTHTINKNVAIFLKKCLNFMDRGFVFKQIKNYIGKFKYGDPKALFDFKFTFIQVICQHEHYVAFNLPLQHNRLPAKDWCNESDMSPSEEFVQNHFLAGTLLKHVHLSLNEAPQKRKFSLSILREIMTKHELDDRYKGKGPRGRIASLYSPWLSIVVDNLHRLTTKELNVDTISLKKSNTDINNDSNSTTLMVPKDTSSITNNICTPRRNRLTLHFDQASPVRNSTHFKDSTFFVSLAGYNGNGNVNGNSNISLNSDVSTMSGDGYNSVNQSFETAALKLLDSKDSCDSVNRYGVMSKDEIRDVLFCFLFVLKNIDDDQLIDWWGNCSRNHINAFFSILEICVDHFKYAGKKKILSDVKTYAPDHMNKTKPMKARTLPARMSPPDFSKEPPSMPDKNNTVNRENIPSINKDKDNSGKYVALTTGWLATEVGLILVDRVCLYTEHFDSLNGVTAKPYLRLLYHPQSESLYKHLFAALRAYINKFSDTLYQGNGILCGSLVSTLLKACDSRLNSLRQEATAMLYLLMRGNFEHTHRKGLTRIHLQVIIAVSRMLGNVVSLNNTRFQESLALINSFASSDKVMKGSGFPSDVKDLTRRIRTVLIATEEMVVKGSGSAGWGAEQERLAELQHTLAVSYRATPRLRHAWLDTMAQHHNRAANHAEAMCCQLHIAALIAEYLRLRGCQTWGAEAFSFISSNIPRDETELKIDAGMVDVQYSEQGLLEQLELCTTHVYKAERYELLGPLYRLILPIYEKMKNFEAISRCYQQLTKAYTELIEIQNSGRRLLGRFYRVAFYGQAYFEDDSGLEYIYKEPKVTTLSEISERLCQLYEHKFGNGIVKMVMDSAPVVASDLDPRFAYIQVTCVQPHFDCSELSQERTTDFERNHDVKRFMYETPFTRDGRAHGNVEEQWKRQTILTTESTFPYVKKRILVTDTCVEEKSPIEVALEEMKTRVAELNSIVNAKTYDTIKLQLRLQGSICVQVNAGPLAYATVFLDPTLSKMYPDDKVKQLRDIFRDFLIVCRHALQINSKLIKSDQLEYQEALQENYNKLCDSLVSLMGENITATQNGNISHTTTVSGAQVDSSTA